MESLSMFYTLVILALINSGAARTPPLTVVYDQDTDTFVYDQYTNDVVPFGALGNGQKDVVGQYDVTAFGAVGNGENDDVKAFEAAWRAACAAETGSVTLTVPTGKTFLVSPITFDGPCKPSKISFLIYGTILAPSKHAFKDGSIDEWLMFREVNGLVVDGNGEGTIDGQGELWWIESSKDSARPTALRFFGCNNLLVRGLNHKNSQRNHVSINGCNNVYATNLNMQAPDDSPNTDGIDISSSTGLFIQDSTIATGDDCIAINGGTSNVNISNIRCGPGHGISIGSLGKNGQRDEVSGITVTGCTFTKTDNGVRIKTWQGGSGFAKNILFSSLVFEESDNPVIINQYYCPHSKCYEQKSAVKISNVRYIGLRGTSVAEDGAINLQCSKTVSCDDIVLNDVDIRPARSGIPDIATCINVRGEARTQEPIVGCMAK